MAEKVNIASLTIDVDDVVKESVRLQKVIDSTKAAQKSLDTTTDEGAASYQKYDAQLKNTKKALRDNQQFVSALDEADKDLTKTMQTENKSTQELRDSRSALNKISKNIKGSTQEEIDMREALNTAIDEQTEALREQGSDFNAGKDKVGEYKQGILDANKELIRQKNMLKETQKQLQGNLESVEEGSEEYENYTQALVVVNDDLDKVNESLGENEEKFDTSILSIEGFAEASQESGGAMKALTSGIKAGAKAMYGLIKSSLAFIATPVGAVLAVIAGAFLLIKNAMNRSEESTAKVKKAFAGLTGIISGVMKVLEPLGKFLIDYLVWYLDKVQKAVFAVADAFSWLTDKIGLDGVSKDVKEFKEEMEKSAEAAEKLVAAELALTKAQRISKKVQLEYQKEAEKFRQIRDDTTQSIDDRIKANENLGKSLKKQSKEELALAQKALNVANLRIKLEGETEDALNARGEAEAEIEDIKERITSQASEQIVNRVSLQKEAAEKAIASQQAELDAYIENQGLRAKTLEEGLKVEREVAKKKIKILNDELKAKLITQAEFDAESLGIKNDLLRSQAELTADNARRELQRYIQTNESKLDSDKFLTEKLFEEEKARLERIAEEKRKFEKLQFDEGLISRTEYNDAINQIDKDNRVANEELEAEREQAKADNARRELQKYIQTNESKLDSDKFLTEKLFEEEKARLKRIAQEKRKFEKLQLDEGLISQTEYNDAINKINKNNRVANEELEAEREQAKKKRLAIDAENRMILKEREYANDYEALTAKLKAEQKAEVAAAEDTGADVALINKKYAKYQEELDEDVNKRKLNATKEMFGGIAQLLGENTAAGKAAAIAQSTMNTWQGVTEVWRAKTVLPEPFGTIAKVASTATVLASGLSAVNEIRDTSTTFSKGDILKGKSHARGGIPFSLNNELGFEAEGGEALINKRSTELFKPLLSSINEAGGGKKFASGDIVGSSATISSKLIDYDLLAIKLSQANESLPNPVVSVEEFNTVNDNVNYVENLASE